jgi:diaminopimelate epimerase
VGDCPAVTTVTLLKYEALGNDFLIALDAGSFAFVPGSEALASFARRICDRHRGVGADGLIVARNPGAGGDVAMELLNADGGRAETSGNGLRCFALALVDAGAVAGPELVVETDGGPVRAEVGARSAGGCAAVSVEMGPAAVGPPERVGGHDARAVVIGNPHLVLLARSLEGVRMDEIGPRLEREVPGGRNVEAVAPDGSGGLELVVWERGAGLTQACGSGSCAAAAAARAAGLVGGHVPVHNPGGTLVVELSGTLATPEATLSGPACRVARVEVEIDGAT